MLFGVQRCRQRCVVILFQGTRWLLAKAVHLDLEDERVYLQGRSQSVADCSVLHHPPVRVAGHHYGTLRLVFKAYALWECVPSQVYIYALSLKVLTLSL